MGTSVALSLIPSAVYIAAWIVALVFAVRMTRSSGGRPEHFLRIGVSLMLTGAVIGAVTEGISLWLVPHLIDSGTSMRSIAQIFGAISIVRACISLAGVILLVYAFWIKFKAKQLNARAE